MQRYFVNKINDKIVFSEQDIFHIKKVMRLKKDDHIEIVYDDKAFEAVIVNIDSLEVNEVEPILKNTELNKELRLFFPLTRSDKMELVIQKASELGATSIVFYDAERSVIHYSQEAFNKKLTRFLMIAKEASEQCHRTKIISIEGVIYLKQIDKYLLDNNLFAYELEAGKTSSLFTNIKKDLSTSLIVGPEGGFSLQEANLLLQMGFNPVSLGARILRCETAAIAGLSVISSVMEQ